MVRERRSRMELRLDLLRVVSNGETKPTRIMYATNTSWKLFNLLLSDLVNINLIEEIPLEERKRRGKNLSKKRYRLTDRGQTLINQLDRNVFLSQMLNWQTKNPNQARKSEIHFG